MSGATITLLIGVISCIIGVLTFISGRISKAERDGRLNEKLDNCVKGIEEIKVKLEGQERAQTTHDIKLGQYEQRIISLEHRVKNIEGKE